MTGKRLFGHWVGGFLLVFLLCAILPTQARAATYSDIEGHWAQSAIERWSESGILKGYENGSFGPDDTITRAQLATVLYRIWGCSPKEGLPYEDLSPDDWYYEALTTMEFYEVVIGQGDHIYPNEELTREEAFYMVGCALGFVSVDEREPHSLSEVSDGEEIGAPYFRCISAMLSAGALHGSSDGKFHPKNLATRAQVITVLDNIFDVCISKPGEYTLDCSQVALVLCGDTQITYNSGKRTRGDPFVKATVYTMAGVGPGELNIVRGEDIDDKVVVYVRGVKESMDDPWTRVGSLEVLSIHSQEMLNLNRDSADRHLYFAGGIGTKTFPYQVETVEQFMNLSMLSYELEVRRTYYVELCNDIELPVNQAKFDTSADVILDGKGHTVTISWEGESAGVEFGMFKRFRGEIMNLNLAGNVDVTMVDTGIVERYMGKAVFKVGPLAGEMWGSISNCTSTVTATVHYGESGVARISAGGMAGQVYGELHNSTFAGNITVACGGENLATLEVGGLSGALEGRMLDCDFTGSITVNGTGEDPTDLLVGGLVGSASGTDTECGTIENSMAAGRITVTGVDAWTTVCTGGIVGLTTIGKIAKTGASGFLAGLSGTVSPISREDFGQSVHISGCGSTADISVEGGYVVNAGGLVGSRSMHKDMPQSFSPEEYGVMENCWSTASIAAKNMSFEGDCGGLVGQHWSGLLRSCWAKPAISVEDGYYHNVGAIVGKTVGIGTVWDCWAEVSGLDIKKAGEPMLYHYGGIMGRQDNEIRSCFVLGNGGVDSENAISYATWSFADVIDCMDMTNTTKEQREKFYDACGWDFEAVWDRSGLYPVLRGCDAETQRKAQGL